MLDVICYDAYGYPIDFLTQWDSNRVAIIEGVEMSPIPRIRFRNKDSVTSIVGRVTVEDDKAYVKIPNSLLTQPYPIILEVFYEYDDGSVITRYFFTIPVVPSKKPADFVFTDNTDYPDWQEVKARAEQKIAELEEDRDWSLLVIDDNEPADEEGNPLTDIIWFNTKRFASGEGSE